MNRQAASKLVEGVSPVWVVDFGAQYAQLIARRVRELGYYSELVSASISAREVLERRPLAIILSGGPASVYAHGAGSFAAEILTLGVPVFGICYGFQLMAKLLGGEVAKTSLPEYGSCEITLEARGIFSGQPSRQSVWMSHGDAVVRAPEGFEILASSAGAAVAGFWDKSRGLAGVQWHPEVRHTPYGMDTLKTFLRAIATPNWSADGVVEAQIANIRHRVGRDLVICGLSGGVDSAVAAALVHQAVPDQLACVFVDHGLLRSGERREVREVFEKSMGMELNVFDASTAFLKALSGVVDPESKRRIIGREFIEAFRLAQRQALRGRRAQFLLQGTLYPDVVESGQGAGSANIKSHHNVGGLPEDLDFELLEPLRQLFKDEVRQVGLKLGLPENLVYRQPFPGPGLAIRIIGEVTADRLELLRRADSIVREETAEQSRQIWQFPVILLAEVRSVGIQGDARTYGSPVVLRPVSSEDAMTADWSRLPYEQLARISNRITNEVPGINRVVLDVTSKPPGTIEWE